jgi:thioredoxin reductase (NADPH)
VFNWQTMVKNIQMHIKKTNFDMAGGLNTENIQYVNCMAAFKSPNEIIYSPDADQIYQFVNTGVVAEKSKVGIISAKNSLISVGGRPVPYPTFKYSDLKKFNYLNNKQNTGVELDHTTNMFLKHGITSDDLFSLTNPPKKALIIGAGYIGLECASFLSKLGCEVTLLARSSILSTFDKDITARITDYVNTHTSIDLMQGYQVDWIKETGAFN